MKIRVFDGERYERGKRWYISFAALFAILIILSLFFQNISGVILLFLFLGGFLFFSLVSMKKIYIEIVDEGLKIGNKFYPWSDFDGFALEIDENTQLIKNIVLIRGNNKFIHTFDDDKDNIKEFVFKLNEKLDMVSDYPQSFVEKFSRTIKLG